MKHEELHVFHISFLAELNRTDSEPLVKERHNCAEQEPPTTMRCGNLTVTHPSEKCVKKCRHAARDLKGDSMHFLLDFDSKIKKGDTGLRGLL
jgi:hypothetical protein